MQQKGFVSVLVLFLLAVMMAGGIYFLATRPQPPLQQITNQPTPTPSPTPTQPTPTLSQVYSPSPTPTPIKGRSSPKDPSSFKINSVSPSSLPSNSYQKGQTTLEVVGKGFQTGAKVCIVSGSSEAGCTSTKYESQSQLFCELPKNLGSGYYAVTVVNPDGEATTTEGSVLYITDQVQ